MFSAWQTMQLLIQQCSTRPSSCLTLSRLPVTSHLMFFNRAISITAPRRWNNDLPPELRTISLPPPPLLPITRHHLHPAPLPITPRPSTQNLNDISSKTLTLTNLIIHPPNLNNNHPNSYSVHSDLLEIGPKLTMDYPLDNPFDLSQCLLISWCAWLLSGALEIPRLR